MASVTNDYDHDHHHDDPHPDHDDDDDDDDPDHDDGLDDEVGINILGDFESRDPPHNLRAADTIPVSQFHQHHHQCRNFHQQPCNHHQLTCHLSFCFTSQTFHEEQFCNTKQATIVFHMKFLLHRQCLRRISCLLAHHHGCHHHHCRHSATLIPTRISPSSPCVFNISISAKHIQASCFDSFR